MTKCIFENLSPQQAIILAKWFDGQGEQDCEIWFDAAGVESPTTDVNRNSGYMEVDESGNVTVYCRS